MRQPARSGCGDSGGEAGGEKKRAKKRKRERERRERGGGGEHKITRDLLRLFLLRRAVTPRRHFHEKSVETRVRFRDSIPVRLDASTYYREFCSRRKRGREEEKEREGERKRISPLENNETISRGARPGVCVRCTSLVIFPLSLPSLSVFREIPAELRYRGRCCRGAIYN